jgi:hypothetical protein
VRQEINEYLTNARKQILAASYQAIAMNEARIENNLAKRVVENPNELSGARPAQPDAPANANTGNANVAPANSAANSNAAAPSNTASSTAANTANRPAAVNAARPAANANANR